MAAAPRSIADALEWLRKRFRPDVARDLAVTYQMELSGSGGGSLVARVTDGQLETLEGSLPEPDVVYRLSADDFFGVLEGTRNPDLLFMEDRIQIDGDLSLALKLRSLFSNHA